MTNSLETIGENSCVTLHFSLAMSDGQIVDSTFESEPASFIVGDGKLPAGFEFFLLGMSKGQTGEFDVPPEKAFGMPNPNNRQSFKTSDFPKDMELAEGLVVSFADANKSELPGVVKSLDGEFVVIDFNHPLSGETLHFKVEIIDVVQAEGSMGQEQ